MHHEVEALKLVRDELAAQAHLFNADVKSNWDALEVRWDDFTRQLGKARLDAGAGSRNVEASAKQLADSLRTSYIGIRKAFKS